MEMYAEWENVYIHVLHCFVTFCVSLMFYCIPTIDENINKVYFCFTYERMLCSVN